LVVGQAPDVEADGIRVWSVGRGAGFRVEIEDVGEDEWRGRGVEDAVDAEWASLRASNARLHDGLILSVRSVDVASGVVRCGRERFRRLAARPAVATGALLLGVTGVVSRVGRGRESEVLLVRRGAQTRVYGGLWEVGPSGGVECPGPGVGRIGLAEVMASLDVELREEVGIERVVEMGPLLGLVEDRRAFSLDVVVGCVVEAGSQVGATGSWEASGVCWGSTGSVVAEFGERLAPSSRVLVEWLLREW